MQHMINPIVFASFLISSQIPGILHHHNGLMIPPVTAADRAQFLVRQGEAFLTIAHVIPGACHGSRQLLHLLLRHVDNVKCQALGRLGPTPGSLDSSSINLVI